MGSVPSDCIVPHVVAAHGLAIEAICKPHSVPIKRVLRLTEDHLVFTANGLKTADSLVVGDSLFGDLEEKIQCKVVSINRETNQRYFGLNCLDSEVLATGIKTSTFGLYHTIPAFWMKHVSKVFGIERASRWGDIIADLLVKMKVL